MIAIVLNHTPCSLNALEVNFFVRRFFYLGGQFGVNLFVILGAWFLCDCYNSLNFSKRTFSSKRIFNIIIQMFFYSVFLDLICLILGYRFSLKTFAASFSYWFCFGYVVMLMAVPFLENINTICRKIIIIFGGVLTTIVIILGIYMPDFFIVKLFLKGIFIGPVWFCYVFLCVFNQHVFSRFRLFFSFSSIGISL